MSSVFVLYHLVRANFLERIRRRNFLIVLFSVVLLSLAIATGRLVLRLDVYVGEYNSAWVGALVAGSTTVLLCFANFFIVKNAIGLDRRTGVGELVASTPMSKFTYLLGKFLSNFAVLVAIEGILFASAIIVQLVHGEANIDWFAILQPFVFIALPAMAAISALALFFETIPGLRSGIGNFLFVCLWFYMLFRIMAFNGILFDLPGILYVDSVFTSAAEAMNLPFSGGFSVEGGTVADPFAQYVRWEGVSWINEMVWWRLYWFLVAAALTGMAALTFDRFDSSRGIQRFLRRKRRKAAGAYQKSVKTEGHIVEQEGKGSDQFISHDATEVCLSGVSKISGLNHFGRILWSEIRMILKRPWWWYLISLYLIAMSLVVPVNDARTFWVPVIWLWFALAISGIGIRESYHRTEQIIFSAPHPLRLQFTATWLAGVVLTTLLGIAGARLFLFGESDAAIAWGVAAFFIPSFAFASGILSGNRRFFEGVFISWWLIGPMGSKGTGLDFMGVHQEVVSQGLHWKYLIGTIFLLILAYAGRWWRLRSL